MDGNEQAATGSIFRCDRKEPGNTVEIATGDVVIRGDLHIPASLRGAVLFAHGSGSSRMSPRNRFVARALEKAGMATLLLDLLTEEEEARDRGGAELRFDIEMLTDRLNEATAWLAQHRALQGVRIGIFGASTGAGGACRGSREQRNCDGGVARRPARPGLARSRACPCACAADRGRRRRLCHQCQSQGSGAARRREEAGNNCRRYPPVRGTGRAGTCRPTGPALVRAFSRPYDGCRSRGIDRGVISFPA